MDEQAVEAIFARIDANDPKIELEVGAKHVQGFLVPAGYSVQYRDDLLANPPRRKGKYVVGGPDSMRALLDGLDGDVVANVYVNPDEAKVMAVLDDHGPDHPGYRELTVTWPLRRSDDWTAWSKLIRAGEVTQAEFAEFLEDRGHAIVSEDKATIIEIARELQGLSAAEWRSGNRLQDGTVQLAYVETVRTQTQQGEVKVPERFTLELPLFDATSPVTVECRLRYKMKDGQLTFRVVTLPPAELERQRIQVLPFELAEILGTSHDIIVGWPFA